MSQKGTSDTDKTVKRKYLSKLGINADDSCIFNTTEIDGTRQKRFDKQRREMGFDDRETWSMDFTLATWLYSHFMWYKKHAPIDLDYHELEIPVWNEDAKRADFTSTKTVTQAEAIDVVLDKLAPYIQANGSFNAPYDEYVYGLHVVAEVMPYMWW